jgi:hypothetical protein
MKCSDRSEQIETIISLKLPNSTIANLSHGGFLEQDSIDIDRLIHFKPKVSPPNPNSAIPG